MLLKDQNILFFTRIMYMGGTENVIYQLCEIFKPIVNNIVVCSYKAGGEKKLYEMGVKYYEIPDIEKKSLSQIIKTKSIINEIIKKERISIIHTHHRMAAFYVRILGLYKKCLFINTSHNTFNDKVLLTRYAFSKAHLIACGEMVKQNLIKVFGLKDITVIHNAVKPFNDVIVEDKVFRTARNNGGYLIANIGRLSKQKGMEFFIKAIPIIKEKHRDTVFYIIGAGEDEKKLKSLAIGEKSSVEFIGFRKDIQNIMSQMDLIVLSSLWEGLPLTPIEAFSVGKTIVATAVDGTIEIVKNNENGLLINPESSEQIADAVCWMIEHPEEKKMMEKRAFKTFEEEFSFIKFEKGYVDYYKDALDSFY